MKTLPPVDWIVIAALALATMTLMTVAASAQQRTFYDNAGRNVGSASTDSNGSTTLRDNMGRTTGRTATDSQGTTTFYDAAGRVTGRSTVPSGGR